MLNAIEQLVVYLTDGDVRQWDTSSESEREDVLAQYERNTDQEEDVATIATATAKDEPQVTTRSITETSSSHTPQSSVVDTVFYSYSHKDEKLRNQLDNHLAVLKRDGIITDWSSRDIRADEDWNSEVDEHLNTAKLILLLLSPDFMASDYCAGIEVRRAMERHAAGKARVIPIILRPVDWQNTPFGELQALPTDAKPVTVWSNLDEAFRDIAGGIRKAVAQLTTSVISASAVSETTSLYIPRPPVVGFAPRRDNKGRDIVQRLREELAPRSNNFIALWGPGGVGKTTIAAEAVNGLLEAFAQRVVWVNAGVRASLTLPALLDEIATQLGRADLRSLAPEPKEEHVRVLVAASPALIVIDGFETIGTEEQQRCAEFLGQRAPCSVLITTRQRVEHARSITIDAMLPDEARAFLELLIAQTQDPQIFPELDRGRIIEMAEGNPLILQWVIAQIDLAQEPQSVLEELAHGSSDAVQRVFDRSFNLSQVGDDGRAVLLALSLFVPSASRPALAEVAGFDHDVARLNEAVKNLRALWLIGTTERNRRLTLEGLTRSLSRARLEKQAHLNEFRHRFISHFLAHAVAHAQATPEDFEELDAEKDNLISAMDVAIEMQEWKSVLRMMNESVLPRMLYTRGYWDEALDCYSNAVMAAQELNDELAAAYFSGLSAAILIERGQYDEGRRIYQDVLAAFKRAGSEAGVAAALLQLGRIAQSQGEPAEARNFYNESLEIRKNLGDHNSIAAILRQLGTLAQLQGELEEARRLYTKSLEINKTLGDQVGIASTLHRLGTIAQDQRNFDEAHQIFTESLEISKKLGNQSGIATTLYELGLNAYFTGQTEEARRLYHESLAISEMLGNQNGIASTLYQLGNMALERGDLRQAREMSSKALSIFEKLKSPYAEITRRLCEKIENQFP